MACAAVLVLISPIAFYLGSLMPESGPVDPLSRIIEIPITAFGTPIPALEFIADWWSELWRYGLGIFTVFEVCGLMVVAIGGIIHLVLCVLLWKSLKKMKQNVSAAKQIEKIQSNSFR
jgi:hypothetical protein